MDQTDDSLRTERTASVLDPAFLEGVDDLPLDELRRRRDLAVVERDFQSYLRRLIQTDHDLLEGEARRRESGAQPRSVVDRVRDALAEAPGSAGRTGSRGEALLLRMNEDDLERAQAIASSLVTPAVLATPEGLSEDELRSTVATLEEAEHAVSANRTAVFAVHDELQAELKRRYSDDPTLIPTDV